MSLFDRPKNTLSPRPPSGLAFPYSGNIPEHGAERYGFNWDAAKYNWYILDDFEDHINGRPFDFTHFQGMVLPPAFLITKSFPYAYTYTDPGQREVVNGFDRSIASLADSTWCVHDNCVLPEIGYEHFIDPFDLFLGYAEPLEQP